MDINKWTIILKIPKCGVYLSKYMQTFQGVTCQLASGQLSLTHNISRVFAFDIDVNNTISNLSLREILQ